MTRPGRIPCLVPFCRRTAAQDKHPGATEIVCYSHWRLLPQPKRRVYSRAWRAAKRAFARQTAPGTYANKTDWLAADRAAGRCERLWRAMRREVIETAAGIGGAA